MKKLFLLPLFAAAFALFSCNDAALKPIDNIAMISEASNGQTTQNWRIAWWTDANNSTSTKTLTCRLGNKATEDVTFSVELDEDYLALYNEQNGTNYEIPPTENYSFPSEVTIGAGEIQANIEIAVKQLREKVVGGTPANPETGDEGTEGTPVPYAIPIRVTSNSDGMKLPARTSRYLYLLDFEPEPYVPPGPLKQYVPNFKLQKTLSSPAFSHLPAVDGNAKNVTIEFLADYGSFAQNACPLGTNNSIPNANDEFYIRYGDASPNSAEQASGYNWFQLKVMGDNGDALCSYNLSDKTFYHWCLTAKYDAESESTKWILYKNGEKHKETQSSGAFSLTGLWLLNGTKVDYRCLAQIRIWSVCREPEEVMMYRWQNVPAKHKDLIAYYPCNDGPGATKLRETVHGYDIDLSADVNSIDWREVTFDNNLPGVTGVEPEAK